MKKTKLIIYILCISLSGILFLNTTSFCSNEDQPTEEVKEEEKPWTGKLNDGTVINKEDLAKILADHKKWLETEGKKGLHANLSKASLNNADLGDADLRQANLRLADLTEADLSRTHLSRAILSFADLTGTDLTEANLTEADLIWANLTGADLTGANLTEANLTWATLTGASLRKTDLQDTNIIYANFKKSKFEPVNVDEGLEFLGAYGFSSIEFIKTQAIVKLRKMAKEAGFRHQERELTAALRKNRQIIKGNKRIFENVFFDLPTDYGANPWRCLLILGAFYLIFSIPYIISLKAKGEEGIWMEWVTKRMKEKMGESKPFRLKPDGYKIFTYGLYFSLLSAFHIGWRDLNVGSWIARIQPREYSLKATGWVRVVSGSQSLISIYLLALWALSYFARPFE